MIPFVRGSILIYVLWILVIIGVLALRLTESSRGELLRDVASARQDRTALQLASALQFAGYRILSGDWKQEKYEIEIDNTQIDIKIMNESGFIPLLEMGSGSLKRAFKEAMMGPNSFLLFERIAKQEPELLRINVFNELREVLSIDDEQLWRLGQRVSLFHEGPVNPRQAPLEVLETMSRVDRYRLQRIRQAESTEERKRLREEVIRQLLSSGDEEGDELSPFYRVIVDLPVESYRVIMKYDRAEQRFKTLSLSRHLRSSEIVATNAEAR